MLTIFIFHPPNHLPEDERSFSGNVASLKNMIQDKTNCSFESNIYIFGRVFYGLSDGGIHFSFQSTSLFSIFSFSVKPLEQKKTTEFYEILHLFQRLHPLSKVSINVRITCNRSWQ